MPHRAAHLCPCCTAAAHILSTARSGELRRYSILTAKGMHAMDMIAPDEPAFVRSALEGRCLVLTLNRPARRNAIDGGMIAVIEEALDRIERDERVRGLILAGAGPVFCAGADLKEPLAAPLERARHMHRLILRLRALPVVSIAAIDGPALGGGLELAMGCTFRVAATSATLGLPEIGIGFIPGFGGTQLLPRIVGAPRALDMILSGAPIDATAGHAIGLVDHLAEPGRALSCAEHVMARYVRHDRAGIAAALAAVRAGLELPLEAGLALELAEQTKLAARR
ncbi:enoyl-CoA hydratase/isomerase family protein [Sphingomonas profundi]|uniref:enoyl-CoA hydratase/isomerase family protein n=1 Tax=Alterirhizorhabdus profundi TaxID=2681549 RepID=UPI0012E85894|nr:enoyl-CoA hydratase/isomerase family protein [Sphingomonas profundi]